MLFLQEKTTDKFWYWLKISIKDKTFMWCVTLPVYNIWILCTVHIAANHNICDKGKGNDQFLWHIKNIQQHKAFVIYLLPKIKNLYWI